MYEWGARRSEPHRLRVASRDGWFSALRSSSLLGRLMASARGRMCQCRALGHPGTMRTINPRGGPPISVPCVLCDGSGYQRPKRGRLQIFPDLVPSTRRKSPRGHDPWERYDFVFNRLPEPYRRMAWYRYIRAPHYTDRLHARQIGIRPETYSRRLARMLQTVADLLQQYGGPASS